MEAGNRVAAVAAALAVVVAAGCGGSGRLSKADYEAKLKAEGAQLKAEFAGLNLTAGANMKALAPKLAAIQTKVEHAADDIDKLKPPQDAVGDNQKIARSLHTFAALFGKLKDAAAKGDRRQVQSLANRLAVAGQEGSQATQDLKAKGYDIGFFGQ